MAKPLSKRRGPQKSPKRRRRHGAIGVPPGTIAAIPGGTPPKISAIGYSEEAYHEETVVNLSQLKKLREDWPALWIHVQGLGDAEIVSELGELFSLHKLALEDVLNRGHAPKLETYGDHLYLIALTPSSEGGADLGQVNLFIGERFVITLQERGIDWDIPVRNRIREGRTRIRKLGANYLGYALLDSIVDRFFPVISAYGEQLDTLEEAVLCGSNREGISPIHVIRSELLALARALSPLKDVVKVLSREEIPPITSETQLYFRDCFDHLNHLEDSVASDRDMARGLIDLHMSSMSNQMNEVMKVLTIIATIFIPLGFIAGLYGMNFAGDVSPLNMPELRWYFGYPFALGLMSVTAVGLIFYFYRKGWIGAPKQEGKETNGNP